MPTAPNPSSDASVAGATQERVTLGVVLIGDEILSGRTRDANLQAIAQAAAPYGVQVTQARVVGDSEAGIVEAVNALRAACTYVVTTGGIGPTHDDITADAVAAAFGVEIEENPDALAILAARTRAMGQPLNDTRRRMARMPKGAQLVKNPVSGAPGFRIGDVFVLAGVPAIARGMLEDVLPHMRRGLVMHVATVRAPGVQEGEIGPGLGALQAQHPQVSLGSYPYYHGLSDYGVQLVARGVDAGEVSAIAQALLDLAGAHRPADAAPASLLEEGAPR